MRDAYVAETEPIPVARQGWGPRRLAGRLAGRPERAMFRTYGPLLIILAMAALERAWWAADLIAFPLLMVVPGILLLRTLRVPGDAVAACPAYVPAASLIVLMLTGLAVDLIGPLLGVSQPIRTVPLLTGVEAVCVPLLIAGSRATASAISWRRIARPLRYAWPLLIPVVAAAGALRLNNGHGDTVAVIALCCCVAALAGASIWAPRADRIQLSVILYAASLAMLWSYSLRGSLVYGFDIATEYHAMHQTVLSGIWHFAHPNDAYGAELSLTVLPAELHFLAGVSDLMVLKLLFPAITAIFPVAVFNFAWQMVRRRWAFIAASFLVAQGAFGQEFSALARQEIAMVFFVAMLAAMLESRMERRVRWTLAAVLAVGMAISHYSTTYFAIEMLAGLVVLQFGVSWFRDVPRVTGAFVVVLIAAVASSAIWYGALTRSASNVSVFTTTAFSQGLDFLPNQGNGANLVESYLNGNNIATLSPADYQAKVALYYREHYSFIHPNADAADAGNALQPAPQAQQQGRLHGVQTGLNVGELVIELLAELLAAIGAIVIALRRSTPRNIRYLALLSVATLGALALIRLSGTVAISYNQQRAFVQAFVILGITMAWVLQYLSKRFRYSRQVVSVITAGALTILFIQQNGLTSAVLGGSTDTNLANSGTDYEQFVISRPEVASAYWLSLQIRPLQMVYADRYAALRIDTQTTISQGFFNDVTPQTLDEYAWIYADRTNVADHRATSDIDTKLATYAFPMSFIEAHYNLVYDNGSSEVFHG